MEQKEVVRKIKEYHIIREILKDGAVQAAAKNPKYAEIVAIFKSYVDFFGKMRIDQFEDFDRFFRRLENNYLAGDPSKKIQPTEVGYAQYVKDVLGKKGLETVTAVASDPDNTKRIRDFTLDVGRAQDSNILMVADALLKGAKYSNILGLYHESVRAGADKDAKIRELRERAGISAKIAHTEGAIIAEIKRLEEAALGKMATYAKENKELLEAIAGAIGKRIDEIEGIIRTADRESRDRDAEILAAAKGSSTLVKYGIGAGGVAVGALLTTGILALSGVFAPSSTTIVTNQAYEAYIADYNKLNTELNALIVDGDMSEADRNTFLNTSLPAFQSKYAGTEFEEMSKGHVESYALLADGIYGVDGAKDILNQYNTDIATLNTTLSGLVVSDGTFTAEEKTAFIDTNVANFVSTYAGTSLESASLSQAESFKAAAESFYTLTGANGSLSGSNTDLTIANDLLTRYNGDVSSLNTKFGSLIADGVLTIDEKDTFIDTEVQAFVDAYAGTVLENASLNQADSFEAVAEKVYGISASEQLFTTYNTDVATLDGTLYTLIADGVYADAEKAEYEGLVDAFAAKYETTALAAMSSSDAKTMKDFSTSIYGMSEEKQVALANYAKASTDIANLQGELATMKTTNEALQSKIDSLTAEVNGLKTQIEDLKNLLTSDDDSKIAELNVKIGQLEEKLKAAEAKYDALKVDYDKVVAENAELTEQVKALTEERDGLKEQLKTAEDKIAALEAEKEELLKQLESGNISVSEYTAKIKELEGKIATLEAEVDGLNSQIESKDAEIKDLTGQITEKDELIEYYEGQVDTLSKENESLKTELADTKALLESAEQKVATLEKEKADLEAQLAAGKITEQEYKDRIAALEASEASLKADVERLTQDLAAKSAELQDKIDAYNQLVADYEALGVTNAETEQKLADAYNEIAALQEELANASAEATDLVFDIYEYITGETTTDINKAMQVISEQLGITTVPPSSESGANVKQPGM